MAVTQNCGANTPIMSLSLTAHQRLRHTIGGSASGLWTLESQNGAQVARSPAPVTREWPAAGEVPAARSDVHSLGMLLGANDSLTWRIDVLDGAGTVIQTVKDCTYDNGVDAQQFFDSISIALI